MQKKTASSFYAGVFSILLRVYTNGHMLDWDACRLFFFFFFSRSLFQTLLSQALLLRHLAFFVYLSLYLSSSCLRCVEREIASYYLVCVSRCPSHHDEDVQRKKKFLLSSLWRREKKKRRRGKRKEELPRQEVDMDRSSASSLIDARTSFESRKSVKSILPNYEGLYLLASLVYVHKQMHACMHRKSPPPHQPPSSSFFFLLSLSFSVRKCRFISFFSRVALPLSLSDRK